MKERLIVYLRGSRIGFIEFDHDANSREFSYDAEYLDRLDNLSERIQAAASELAEEMSDEGHPSPIYARIGEVIRKQMERVA